MYRCSYPFLYQVLKHRPGAAGKAMVAGDGAANSQLQIFVLVVFIFHFSEFALAWLFMREELGWHCGLVPR
jgi:hypothetical protein